MKKTAQALVFSLIGMSIATAQNNPALQAEHTTLQQFGEQVLQTKDASGYVSAIALVAQCKNNTPVGVYLGRTEIHGKGYPIQADSLFQIASITKSFIVVVILQLAAEHHFSLDDPTLIGRYFPEYPKWSGITLRELMNMTSGIPGNGNSHANDIFMKFTAKEYASYISPTQMLNLTYAYPLDFKPGTSWEYSNTNYILLGQFIQRVTHHSPEAEVNTRIIQKLGLHHTYFPINTIQEIPSIPVNDIVHGYAFTSKSYHPYAFMRFGEDITRFSLSEFGTAGAMVSTPADINRYLHALYTPGILLTAAQLKEVTTLVSRVNGTPFHSENDLGNPLGYGLGIIGYRWPSHQQMIYLYNGTSNGFNFTYLYDPKKQLYLTYAVNSLADLDQDFSRSMKLFGELGCGT